MSMIGTFAVVAVALADRGGPGSGNLPAGMVKVEGTITGVNPVTGQVAITTRAGVTVVVVAVPGTKVERNGRPRSPRSRSGTAARPSPSCRTGPHRRSKPSGRDRTEVRPAVTGGRTPSATDWIMAQDRPTFAGEK